MAGAGRPTAARQHRDGAPGARPAVPGTRGRGTRPAPARAGRSRRHRARGGGAGPSHDVGGRSTRCRCRRLRCAATASSWRGCCATCSRTRCTLRSDVRVECRWRATDGGVTLTVRDDGPGVPAAERAPDLRPVRPAGRARGRADTGGSGLGLAIVAAVARRHGGAVELLADGSARRRDLRAAAAGGRAVSVRPSRSGAPPATRSGSSGRGPRTSRRGSRRVRGPAGRCPRRR